MFLPFPLSFVAHLLFFFFLLFLPFPISFVAHLLFFSFSVWVGSLAIGLTFFLGSLGSLLCQTIGCRFTSILGCLVCAVSLLVTPHSTSLEWMFLTYRCVFGIGSALMLSSYFLITAKNFRRWQSLAVGIVTVGGSSGLLIMGPLLQLLIDIFGWRGTYRILSIPFFVMACVCGVTFGDPLPDTSEDLSRNCKTNQCNSKLLSESEGHPEMEMNAIDKKQTTVNEERKVKIFESECQTETQQRSQIWSSHAAAKTDGSREANCLGKLNTLLDFSVFKIPCYTVAVLSLCLMKFGHFIPQIHMVSQLRWNEIFDELTLRNFPVIFSRIIHGLFDYSLQLFRAAVSHWVWKSQNQLRLSPSTCDYQGTRP